MSYNIAHASNESNISIDVQQIVYVQDFKYFGAMMLSSINDVKHRKALASMGRFLEAWSHMKSEIRSSPSQDQHFQNYRTPYGCESWIIKPYDEISINAFETSCYRIKLGVKRLDKVTNIEVYQRTAQVLLMSTIRARQLRWLGHQLRHDKSEPTRELALYEPQNINGKGKQGHTITYKYQIASLLKNNPELVTTKNDRRPSLE